MLTARVERYGDCVGEMIPLYRRHFREVALDQDRHAARLAPRFGAYDARDAAGEVVLVTLRDEGRLVGYFLCLLTRHLHYRHCLTGCMDIIYVDPAVRGRFGGIRLIRTMITELRRRGVHRLLAGEKIHCRNGLGRLYQICGMRPIETYYSIWLGGE